jgi:hypothetical protein
MLRWSKKGSRVKRGESKLGYLKEKLSIKFNILRKWNI